MPPSSKVGHDPLSTTAVLSEALRLQRIGISVIPVTAKKPAVRTWKQFQRVPADERQVFDWYDGRDDLGLAILLGEVSGNLVVRDFDQHEAWQRWASDYPKLELMLPAVQTSRGKHVYARIPDCQPITHKDGELRSKGQYVLAPPSVHPTGQQYLWIRDLKSLADVPLLTLDESGFGRCWSPSRGKQPHDTDSTDRTQVDSVRSVLSVLSVSPEELIESTLPHAFGTRRHRLFELAVKPG